MLLPDSMEVRVCVPYNSRSTAWASFDGRGRIELKRKYGRQVVRVLLILKVSSLEGDYIKVTASKYPFPTVCAEERSVDWFQSISRTLRWNEREKQKSFVVVEEERPKPVKGKASRHVEDEARKGVPHDDHARVKASQQEAQDGQDSLAKKTSEEATRQSRQGGEKAEDGDSEETSEDDEEDEAFDIDEYVFKLCYAVLLRRILRTAFRRTPPSQRLPEIRGKKRLLQGQNTRPNGHHALLVF